MKKLLILACCLFGLQTLAQKTLIIEGGGTLENYHRDADLDTFGDPNVTMQLAAPIPGWVKNRLDCDDTDPNITTRTFYYPDTDGDGFGSTTGAIASCTPVAGYVTNNLDNCPTQYSTTNNGCPITGLITHDFGSYNYIYTEVLKVAATEATYNGVSNSDKIRSISYFDGLGRKMQSRGIAQSPLGKDIVEHVEYDIFGRQNKEFLPFTSTQNNGFFETSGNTKTISQYNVPKYGNTTNPYNEKIYDGSPLNRVLETGAPGAAWLANPNSDNDHTMKFTYTFNSATDNTHKVRRYITNLDSNYSPTLVGHSSIYYPLDHLYKDVVKNENWTTTSGKLHTTEEFKNKFGQLILKRTYAKIGSTVTPHDTYYVYDVYNNLSFVIPPKVDLTNGISTTELNELCFQYKYDEYNRLVEKKLPGKGWEYIVYDKLDRPILTQDAAQRAKPTKEWLFTKYDAFGRITYTGIYKDNRTRIQVQTSAENHSSAHESRASALFGYSNNSYPVAITSNDVYTVNYYDDYNFDTAGLSVPITVYGESTTSNVNSLSTGSKERILTDSGTYWLTNIIGYDDKARTIYMASKNSFLNTTDVVQTKLDFIGKITESTSSHTSNTTVVIVDKFTYDNSERLLTHKQTINSQPEELIVQNSYDELGRLERKKVGNTETKPLQTIDLKYNVRGWLTEINDVDNIGTDLFTFKINYDTKDIPTTLGFSSLYDGNIAETVWRTQSDSKKRGYQYKYDALNRIKGANFREENNLLSGSGKFETEYSYDKNGNITNLVRNGATGQTIDELDYTYTNNTNELIGVVDQEQNSEGVESFTNNYTYDIHNGNLLTDSGKGITYIEYNYLNLPTKVHFGATKRIEYIYTARGIKVQKKVINSGTTTTDYAGNFIYENDVLKHFSHPEGYVEKLGSSFTYVYQYTDHLGNVRLNYNNAGSSAMPSLQIKEENNYYPFGMKMQGVNTTVVGTQNDYKYNGKELQDEVINGKKLQWYDYGARNYDPSIGRFFNIDPLADSPAQSDKSSFAYTWNNPIRLTDPDGMHPDSKKKEEKKNELGSIGVGSTTYDCRGGNCGAGIDSSGSFVIGGKVSATKKKSQKNVFFLITKDGKAYVTSEKIANRFLERGATWIGDVNVFNGIISRLKKAGYNPHAKPEATLKYVNDMIDVIPDLKKWYKRGKSAKIWIEPKNKKNPHYDPAIHGITLTAGAFRSNYALLTTMFHESYHSAQYKFVGKNGMTEAQWAKKYIGSTKKGGKGHSYLEAEAYHFQIHMGDRDGRVLGNYNKYYKRYTRDD